MNRHFRFILIFALLTSIAFAKNKSDAVMVLLWPNANKPTLKLSFGKFQQEGMYAGQYSFMSDVLVENVSTRTIPRASFTIQLLDKNKVRVGDGVLHISDLDPGQVAKIPFQVNSTGLPMALNVVADNDASGIPTSLKTIPLNIISVPVGAKFKVDGTDAGITPKIVNLQVGTHTLEFSKEGYATGSTPVEVTDDELPGGSITFELGGLAADTVELRNGTVLLGDVISLSMSSIVIRVDGIDKTYDRNQINKIMLVQRVTSTQPAATPVTMQQQK